VTLFSLVVCMGVTYAVPLESTTVGILIPPPSDDDSDDDAVVSKFYIEIVNELKMFD